MRSTLWVDVPLAALLPAGDEARVTVPRPMKGEDWACAMARRQTDAELVFYWDGDSLYGGEKTEIKWGRTVR